VTGSTSVIPEFDAFSVAKSKVQMTNSKQTQNSKSKPIQALKNCAEISHRNSRLLLRKRACFRGAKADIYFRAVPLGRAISRWSLKFWICLRFGACDFGFAALPRYDGDL